MQVSGPTMCMSCIHLKSIVDDFGRRTKCDAYPLGIPAKYVSLGDPHLVTDHEDHGIVYEKDPKSGNLLTTYLEHHPDVDVS